MSNHLISQVYQRQVGGLACTAVMVLLADKASDDGSGIWASKPTIADELGTSKPTVISAIKSLLAAGLICETGTRPCKGGYTVEYRIDVDVLQTLPLVPCRERKRSGSFTGNIPSPVKNAAPTGKAASQQGESSFTQTLREPPMNLPSDTSYPQGARETKADKSILGKPDDVSDQVWADFVAHRRRRRADLTSTALNGIRSQAVAAGWTLEAALTEMVARGWTGFKAEWVQESSPAGRQSDRQRSVSQIGLAVAQRRRAARVGRDQPAPLLENHHDNDGVDLTAGMASIIGSSVR